MNIGGGIALLAGVLLMGWIASEASMLRQPVRPHWIELFSFALGLAMPALVPMVWRA